MRLLSTLIAFLISVAALAQDKDQKIIIITTDGLRWQEVFKGMDAEIAKNPKFNQEDSAGIFKNIGIKQKPAADRS